jgi:hypothetical protein
MREWEGKMKEGRREEQRKEGIPMGEQGSRVENTGLSTPSGDRITPL